MLIRPLAAALLATLTSQVALAGTPEDCQRLPLDSCSATVRSVRAQEAPARTAAQALPELRPPTPRSVYQDRSIKEALTRGTHLVFGASLSGANPATAVTLAEVGGLAILHFPGTAATAPEVQGLALAARTGSQVLLGHFDRADDPYLKQKMDAGMQGAVLDRAEDPTEVRAFMDRLFFSPLGNRPGGPAYASGFLSRFGEMIQEANDVVIGGVGISTARGVERIEEIAQAADAGLTLVMVDPVGIARSMGVAEGSAAHRAAVARVEQAARQAGVALGGQASSRQEAAEMSQRGYRHVLLGSDLGAVDQAFGRYEETPGPAVPGPRSTPQEWNVRRWMQEGRLAEVGFLMTPDLRMAHRLATRSDALWIDAEHGPFAPQDVKSLLAHLSSELPVLVRVQSPNHPDLVPYLQAGARGIIAPNVESAAQAADFVARVKDENPQATAVVMIETRKGLENAEEIASVPGIDVLHLGPYDLALSLRTPMGSETHRAAVARIEEAARAAGVPLGGASPTRSRSLEMAGRGYGMVTTVSDQEALLATFRGLLPPPEPEQPSR